mmetsp:Transcript_15038/g.26497  ORF Transcript_15038/g.26497 Transcript_15038/m.26497 type:complete len:220 (-) Transcript_15038:883-1542(-)
MSIFRRHHQRRHSSLVVPTKQLQVGLFFRQKVDQLAVVAHRCHVCGGDALSPMGVYIALSGQRLEHLKGLFSVRGLVRLAPRTAVAANLVQFYGLGKHMQENRLILGCFHIGVGGFQQQHGVHGEDAELVTRLDEVHLRLEKVLLLLGVGGRLFGEPDEAPGHLVQLFVVAQFAFHFFVLVQRLLRHHLAFGTFFLVSRNFPAARQSGCGPFFSQFLFI